MHALDVRDQAIGEALGRALVDQVAPARLSRVRLVETPKNAVECGEGDE